MTAKAERWHLFRQHCNRLPIDRVNALKKSCRLRLLNRVILFASILLIGMPIASQAAEGIALSSCRLQSMRKSVLCGSLKRALNPAQAQGPQIDIHVAVLPAHARHKKADPIFVFAGGPGQSAIELAAGFDQLLGRFRQRRDVVLIDQRGTGRSAPLHCPTPAAAAPLAEQLDLLKQAQQLQQCLKNLQAHKDLRYFTTTLAMQDADTVRQALGYESVNLIGASYGTRAALEYMRLYPSRVRRAVLDGVAPPDMNLPQSAAHDAHSALQKLLNDCEKSSDCNRHYPSFRQDWQALRQGPARTVTLAHPVTGQMQTLTLSPAMLTQAVRNALYSPVTASVLAHAITEGQRGDFKALIALAIGDQGPKAPAMYLGMHMAVVCAEDAPGRSPSSFMAVTSGDFSDDLFKFYRSTCSVIPPAQVDPDFYKIPVSKAPILLLSGGDDPATPPRHAARVANALGAKAHHAVIPHAAHGTLNLPCINEAVFGFIQTDDAREARFNSSWGSECAAELPRPSTFVMPGRWHGERRD